MENPLGVSPSKRYQGTTRGKENNSYDLGGNRTHDLRIRRVSMGLTDRRKTAKNLVDSRKNWKILTVSRKWGKKN